MNREGRAPARPYTYRHENRAGSACLRAALRSVLRTARFARTLRLPHAMFARFQRFGTNWSSFQPENLSHQVAAHIWKILHASANLIDVQLSSGADLESFT
jgi:hypothetical protein